MSWSNTRSLWVLLLLIGIGVLAGCQAAPAGNIGYKPPFLPVRISIDNQGKVAIEAEGSVVTFLGEFSIEGGVDVGLVEDGALIVVLQNRNTGYAYAYKVLTSDASVSVVVDGTTRLDVSRDKVVIDITDGQVRTIDIVGNVEQNGDFGLEPGSPEASSTPKPTAIPPGPTDACSPIVGDVRWTRFGSPYIVQCDLQVAEDSLLHLEPGTVVKFAQDARMLIDGALEVAGEETNPVIFTSLFDDSVGGDTNNDGSTREPAPGSWGYLGFTDRSDDRSVVEHLTLRYGGAYSQGVISLWNASPTLRAITFEQNGINAVQLHAEQLTSDTWDNTDVVYYLNTKASVAPDQLLTIAPGMVVKFGPERNLFVDGALQVGGTPEQPVIFTSLFDDSVGGDTNNDGSTREPAPGSWGYLGFTDRSSDDHSSIDNLILRYGGAYNSEPLVLFKANPQLGWIGFEHNGVNTIRVE